MLILYQIYSEVTTLQPCRVQANISVALINCCRRSSWCYQINRVTFALSDHCVY